MRELDFSKDCSSWNEENLGFRGVFAVSGTFSLTSLAGFAEIMGSFLEGAEANLSFRGENEVFWADFLPKGIAAGSRQQAVGSGL